MLPLVVHQNRPDRVRDTHTDRPMSVTQVEFPGLRNINGREELGSSRWSFTRINQEPGLVNVLWAKRKPTN